MSLTSAEYARQITVEDFGGSHSSRLAQRAWADFKKMLSGINKQKVPVDAPRVGTLSLALVAAVVTLTYPSQTRHENFVSFPVTQDTFDEGPLSAGTEGLEGAPGYTGINTLLEDVGEIPVQEEAGYAGHMYADTGIDLSLAPDVNANLSGLVPSEGYVLIQAQDGEVLRLNSNGMTESASVEETEQFLNQGN